MNKSLKGVAVDLPITLKEETKSTLPDLKVEFNSTLQFQVNSRIKKQIKTYSHKHEISLSSFARYIFEIYIKNEEIRFSIDQQLQKMIRQEEEDDMRRAEEREKERFSEKMLFKNALR